MQTMSITSFYKCKGSRSDLSNQRGVFCLSKVRSVLDKLLHSDVYDHIDANLSDSNVGGRKERNIRDHIFVLNNVINDVVNGDGEELDIQGIDISKCFDEMGYEETHNDMWDVCIKDNKFSLIAKLDEKVRTKVKTPEGSTKEFSLERLVLQGSVNASLKCSIQMETLNNDCMKMNGGSVLYKYKGLILIPPLEMIDDILMVSKCGPQAVEANAVLNTKIESKKLRLSRDKCYHMHVSNKNTKCDTSLKVHDSVMKKTSTASYLGDSITPFGSCEETLKERELKALGFITQIKSILKNVSLGIFYFQTAIILRDSMFVNGILTNVECWNFIPEKGYKILEDLDIRLFNELFGCKSNKVLYYLESSKIPLRHSIAKRRFMYLYHLLSRNENEIISKVYSIQKLKNTRKDWYQMICQEKEKYKINLSDEEIQQMSKNKFKQIVSESVDKFAFSQLLKTASEQSKCHDIVKQIKSDKFVIQKYLVCEDLVKEEQQLLFSLRCHAYPVKTNAKYLYEDLSCRACMDPQYEESVTHFTQTCSTFQEERKFTKLNVEDIYGSLQKQIKFIRTFKVINRKWKLILELK